MLLGIGQQMTEQEISEAEIRIIRWGEKILTPLLVAGFLGIISFLVYVNETVAQLQTEHEKYNGLNGDITQSIKNLDSKVESLREEQQETEVKIGIIQTNQTHVVEELKELKDLNLKILNYLKK